jgi:hypothetical protein
MSSLTIRRIIVWVISMGLGFIIGNGIISLGFDLLPLFTSIQAPQGLSIQEYGIIYFLFTAVPIGLVFVIWLDAFMDTRILPD